MEAIAKYDFKATADDELSFKRGDILKVSAAAKRMPRWPLCPHLPPRPGAHKGAAPPPIAHCERSPACEAESEMDAGEKMKCDFGVVCAMYGL